MLGCGCYAEHLGARNYNALEASAGHTADEKTPAPVMCGPSPRNPPEKANICACAMAPWIHRTGEASAQDSPDGCPQALLRKLDCKRRDQALKATPVSEQEARPHKG